MTSPGPRLQASILACFLTCFLGLFFFNWTVDTWRNYWLLKDGQPGVAVVTRDLGHNGVEYRYSANGKEYMGKSGRNWGEPKYSRVGPGEKSGVYFSLSSKRWL